jgi:transposase
LSKHILPLIPSGLLVQQVVPSADTVTITTAPKALESCCPVCGHASRRVHSRYLRTLADLPWQGRAVLIRIEARRFRCTAAECPRRIFTERLPAIAAGPWSRRTGRLGEIQRYLGLALGGQAGARLAERLAMPASGDTLLMLVRRTEPEEPAVVRAVGLDDWAWRKGHRYGTIVVDLERHKVVDLLPDREADTVAQWLAEHPEIEVVSRDRGAAYADAARRGAPQALQAADRWHLLENLGQAVRAALDRHGSTLREAAQGVHSPITGEQEASDTPPPMTSAERRQYEGWERRRAAWDEAVRLHGEGLSIKAIVRQLGLARNTVRKLVRGGQPEARRPRRSSLMPYVALLERRWAEGCRNGAQLWRETREAGFRGGQRVVTEWVTRQRLASRPERAASALAAPSRRRLALLLTGDPADWTSEERLYLERLFNISPEIAALHDLAQRFGRMVRQHGADDLTPWLAEALESDLRSFAEGLRQDLAAVWAALATPWSNGQTEGQITRLKLIKRSMYGRAKLDLLRIRVMAA